VRGKCRSKYKSIQRVPADPGVDLSGHDEGGCRFQEPAKVRNFLPGKVEFVAELSGDLINDKIGDDPVVMGYDIFKQRRTGASTADRRSNEYG